MRFATFQDIVKRRIYAENATSDIDPFLNQFVNSAYKIVAGESGWKDLRVEDTITTVDGQESYIMPVDFGRPAFFWHNELGYNYRLLPIPERKFVGSGVDGTLEGYPYWYRMFGNKNVLAQPSSASIITFVSSNTDNASIRVEGIVSGYPDGETITLNNTTEVSTTKLFSRVDRITKSASTTGRVTATSNSGAVTITVLPAGLLSDTLRRKWVKLFYIPDDEYTLYNYYYRKVFNMVDDNDSPVLDEDFDEAIILKATQLGLANEQGLMDAAKKVWLDYTGEIKRLKKNNLKDDDWKPLLASFGSVSNIGKGLNFGPYYPSIRR